MNIRRIRIRMPKWQDIRSASWAKELLMTFVGATLSIILTFGTAHFVEERQNRREGRQTAMMVIHDMENTVEIFRKYASEDEHSFTTSQYVRENMHRLDSIPDDSLLIFVQYVTRSAGSDYSYDESCERTFLSSQEAWKNINNAAFIDVVQYFYHYRRIIYTMMQEDYLFEKPITNREFHQLLLENQEQKWAEGTFYQHCVERFRKRSDVDLYVSYSYFRRNHYNQYAEAFRTMANRCKFMMNISDEELAQYVQEKERTGKRLTEKKLIGKWEMQTSDELHVIREFKNDYTVATSYSRNISYSCYTGQLILKYTLNHTWELQGDSLYTEQLPDYTFEIDRSQMHYSPEMAEAIDQMVKRTEQNHIEWLEGRKTQSEPRRSQFASIDASGNKIELRNPEGRVIYLIRCDTP